jgi:hypothetical protein
VVGDAALGVGAAVADAARIDALAVVAGLICRTVVVGAAAGDAGSRDALDAVLAVVVGAAGLETLSVGRALLAAGAVGRTVTGGYAETAGASRAFGAALGDV